jgi:NAD(P)-dependent dehydrogenase (short-subunit alcohol dehydrogenase family)
VSCLVRRHSGGDYAAPQQGGRLGRARHGANRGIGLAFVRELAARGAKKVYAGVRSPDALAEEFAGLPAEVVPLDVTDPAAAAAANACPDVNLLVNNAGLFTNTRLVRTGDPDAARREMEVNYFGVLNMTRAFAPLLGANDGGYIVNVPASTTRTSSSATRSPSAPRFPWSTA